MHSTTRIFVDRWDMLCWMFPISRRKCIDVGDNKDEEDTGLAAGEFSGAVTGLITCEIRLASVCTRTKGEENGAV